jgi:hypothetical protein
VILPWSHQKVGDPNFPATGEVYQEGVKGLPGLAEESRAGDANGQWARVLAGNGVFTYLLDQTGVPRFGLTNFLLKGANPPKADLPDFRYDKDCETQEVPNLNSRAAPPLELVDSAGDVCQILIPVPGTPTCALLSAILQAITPGPLSTGSAPKLDARAKSVIRTLEQLEDKPLELKDGVFQVVDGALGKEGEEKDKQEQGLPELPGTGVPGAEEEKPKEEKGKQEQGLPGLPSTGVSGTGEGGG